MRSTGSSLLAARHEAACDEPAHRHAEQRGDALDLELDAVLVRDRAHAPVDLDVERAPGERAVEEDLADERTVRPGCAELGGEREERAAVVVALLARGVPVRAAVGEHPVGGHEGGA